MKTVSVRLEDSVYEELGAMLDAMGQTKQTFYETFTRTALRERCIPFIVKAPAAPIKQDGRLSAFERLEESRIRNSGRIDYEAERGAAMEKKYGPVD